MREENWLTAYSSEMQNHMFDYFSFLQTRFFL